MQSRKELFSPSPVFDFFPIITEGPISRYGQLGEELKAEHHFDYKQFCFGAQLIVWGLFQKVLLSDRVNMYVRAIFANHEKYSGFPVIMAILLYTFQLYMDFAGCINIAREARSFLELH